MKTTVHVRSSVVKNGKIRWTFDMYIKGILLGSFVLESIHRWYIDAYPKEIILFKKNTLLPLAPDYHQVTEAVLDYFNQKHYQRYLGLEISGYYNFLGLDGGLMEVDAPYITKELFQKATTIR